MTTFRIIFVFAIGYGVMFIWQKSLITTGNLPFGQIRSVPDPFDWAEQYYQPATLIVFLLSCLATLIWYGVASYFNDRDRKPGIKIFRGLWAALTLLPFFAILWAISSITEGEEVVPSLVLFYVLDVIWLFWFGTAISTPEALKYGVVPGSYYLRHLPFLK